MQAGVPSELSWMVILSRLTDMAAQWAGPYMIQVATGTTPPWADADAFARDFEDHFCAVNNKNAAIAELRKLTKQSHKLGTVKDYTTVTDCGIRDYFPIFPHFSLFFLTFYRP